jgi:hypothetical protein
VTNRSKFKGLFDARQQPSDEPAKRGRGRPAGNAGGKRDDAEFTQASAYVPRELHKKVKAALALEEKEYSELVAELLDKWLKSRS